MSGVDERSDAYRLGVARSIVGELLAARMGAMSTATYTDGWCTICEEYERDLPAEVRGLIEGVCIPCWIGSVEAGVHQPHEIPAELRPLLPRSRLDDPDDRDLDDEIAEDYDDSRADQFRCPGCERPTRGGRWCDECREERPGGGER